MADNSVGGSQRRALFSSPCSPHQPPDHFKSLGIGTPYLTSSRPEQAADEVSVDGVAPQLRVVTFQRLQLPLHMSWLEDDETVGHERQDVPRYLIPERRRLLKGATPF